MKTLREAIVCIHTLIVSINIWNGRILTFKVIRCHRSKTSMWPQVTSNDLQGQTHIPTMFLNPILIYMQKNVALGLAIKELPYIEVFDLQWPIMTSEVKILQTHMLIDTMRVCIQKIASLSITLRYNLN